MARILFLCFLILLSVSSRAQDKVDVIVKLNGEELKGTVKEITSDEVKFAYKGETAVYAVKKSEILKIIFASGRVEMYNQTTTPSAPAPAAAPASAPASNQNTADVRNKVAILPFSYIQDGQRTVDELSVKVQNECYAYLMKHAGVYTYTDPRTSNALLIKAGVTAESIKGFTMDEICNILGVEYVIEGIVSVNPKSQTGYQSNNYNSTAKNNNKTSTKTDYKTTGSTYSTTQQTYETTTLLSVYNNQGKSVFSEEKKSFWSTKDAYKSTLEYLLKKMPLYSK